MEHEAATRSRATRLAGDAIDREHSTELAQRGHLIGGVGRDYAVDECHIVLLEPSERSYDEDHEDHQGGPMTSPGVNA